MFAQLSGNGKEYCGVSASAGGGVFFSAGGGIFSAGVVRPEARTFSDDVVGVGAVVLSSLGVVPLLGDDPLGGGGGASTLPRMIGSPSLPLPIITVLAFGDCAS